MVVSMSSIGGSFQAVMSMELYLMVKGMSQLVLRYKQHVESDTKCTTNQAVDCVTLQVKLQSLLSQLQ